MLNSSQVITFDQISHRGAVPKAAPATLQSDAASLEDSSRAPNTHHTSLIEEVLILSILVFGLQITLLFRAKTGAHMRCPHQKKACATVFLSSLLSRLAGAGYAKVLE